jgi:hypothetical protein
MPAKLLIDVSLLVKWPVSSTACAKARSPRTPFGVALGEVERDEVADVDAESRSVGLVPWLPTRPVGR